MKLNLGCGADLRKEYLNIDVNRPQKSKEGKSIDEFEFKQSDVSDLSWLEDDSIDEIMGKDILDHIHWRDLSNTLAEWYRVIKPGGYLYLRDVPDFEKDVLDYLDGSRDTKEWEHLQRWVERLAYPEENQRSKNLIDFPRLKKMLEKQNFTVLKHWYEKGELNLDCQKT